MRDPYNAAGSRPLSPEAADGIRHVFARAGFDEENLGARLGATDYPSPRRTHLPLQLYRTRGGEPLDTLARLFVLGVPVPQEEFRAALAPAEPAPWIDGGLVQTGSKLVRARLKVVPLQGTLIAADFPPGLGEEMTEDHVLGVNSSALTLAKLTVRPPVGSTLDLGAGCGVQAFLATAHSERVVATDLNRRAVDLAVLNTRLNGLTNVECLQGDLFQPVEGRRFDLIVSNPPFVISPEMRYVFRDGGLGGDAFSRRVIREAPNYLADGGCCQLVCNWAHVSGEDWRERLATWFEGSGCDVWVMRVDTLDPAAYATMWIGQSEGGLDAARFDEWMAYYAEERIEAISFGLVTMRRSGRVHPWLRLDDGPRVVHGHSGDQVLRRMETYDRIEAGLTGRALLTERLRLGPNVRLQRETALSPEGWETRELKLRVARGLCYSEAISEAVAVVVRGCDGGQPLGALLEANGAAGDDHALRTIERLVERGLLVTAG